jgi:hypothetical protein
VTSGPFFQYAVRSTSLQYAPSEEYRAVLQEQRDRELEDYLANVLGNGTWTNPLRLGPNRLWVDSTGRLRVKTSAPTSDTDGTVVGTQT